MPCLSLFERPCSVFRIGLAELGLSLILCSYYLTGISSDVFNAHVIFFIEIFPLFYAVALVLLFFFSGSRLFLTGAPFFVFLCFLFVLCLFSYFIHGGIRQSFYHIVVFFYNTVVLGALAWMVVSLSRFSLMRFYLYFCFLVSIIIIYAFFWGESHAGRLSLSGKNPIYLSLLSALTLCVSFFCVCAPGSISRPKFLFFFFCLLVSFLGLMFSGSKGAILSFVAVLVFYSLVVLKSIISRGKIKRRTIVSSVVVLSIISGAAVYFVDSRAVGGVLRLIVGDVGDSGSVRISLLSQWMALYRESPFLGLGLDDRLTYPHNVLLELVFRYGILGAFAAVFLIYIVIRYTAAGFNSASLEKKILSALIFCSFFAGLFSFSIAMKSHLFVFIVFACVYFRRNDSSCEAKGQDRLILKPT